MAAVARKVNLTDTDEGGVWEDRSGCVNMFP